MWCVLRRILSYDDIKSSRRKRKKIPDKSGDAVYEERDLLRNHQLTFDGEHTTLCKSTLYIRHSRLMSISPLSSNGFFFKRKTSQQWLGYCYKKIPIEEKKLPSKRIMQYMWDTDYIEILSFACGAEQYTIFPYPFICWSVFAI